MATQGGFGLTVQIDVSSVLSVLVKVINVDIPAFRNFIAEATTHDSAGGYYEAVATGKKRVEPFTCILAWDKALSSHAAILTAFNSGDPVTFTVADPDGDETIQTEIIVEIVRRMGVQEDIFKCEVTLHPTGQPTITP